jgi:hypothetical protein
VVARGLVPVRGTRVVTALLHGFVLQAVAFGLHDAMGSADHVRLALQDTGVLLGIERRDYAEPTFSAGAIGGGLPAAPMGSGWRILLLVRRVNSTWHPRASQQRAAGWCGGGVWS